MDDPLNKACAKAPPMTGSGCIWRYDPEHLGPELGTDFPDAEACWKRYLSELAGGVESSVTASGKGGIDTGSSRPSG